MDEIKEQKHEIRSDVAQRIQSLSDEETARKNKTIENRLFGFANFLEATISLLYMHQELEVNTRSIIERSLKHNKVVVLPAYHADHHRMTLYKIDDLKTDLVPGPRGVLEPNPDRCKIVPIDRIDIAIVPSVALDEKGGRIGSGTGYYDRFLPDLPITTRKVGLAYECQIVPQVPMEAHDRYIDILITEDRIIYKI